MHFSAECPARPVNPAPASPRTPADAFDALYGYAAPALVRQAYLLTGRPGLARESVERAFHRAWERWPDVAVDRDPAGWVRAATHEHALSPWHRLRPGHREEPRVADDDPALRLALLALPPSYRRTLLLFDGLRLGLAETAAETEASTPAAGHRLLHAREAVAARIPEAADPERLQARLAALLTAPDAKGAEALPPPVTVREGGERRVRLWVRGTVTLTTVIAAATLFTLATAPTRYEPPVSPGQAVAGVPALGGGQQQLSARDRQLRERLGREAVTGPPRLVPDAR
ncbi:hypothetical protein I3F58_06885 [Streptomyces sp. MUM 203J]|uniref:hypothetical protein n=1 Tax=Streptomyces sp. MUM 203J TaxID=2791990 RepID=UPI001F036271|nr:hypothetical protein [Streptomyces sp. MUM 203J]MCH0539288.1 hypothetical protein [Streptomyces sp. MUM 203J]